MRNIYYNYYKRDVIDSNSVNWLIRSITDGDNFRADYRTIIADSVVLRESLCSSEQLTFGACEASSFEFKYQQDASVFETAPVKIGTQLEVRNSIAFNVTTSDAIVGYYYVVDAKYNNNDQAWTIKCYDKMYLLNNTDVTAWYEALEFPLTVKQFRDSFCAVLGINQVDIDLVNDNLPISRTLSGAVSGADILQGICEANACFGHFNWQGKLKYVQLKSTNTKVNIMYNEMSDLKLKGFSRQINRLIIRETEDDDGGADYGGGDNAYIIQGNYIFAGKTAAELNTIAASLLPEMDTRVLVSQLTYYNTCEFTTYGCPIAYELGDIISLNNSASVSVWFETYVLNRVFKGTAPMTDTFETPGNEYYVFTPERTDPAVKEVKGRVANLEDTTEDQENRISAIESGTALADIYLGLHAKADNATHADTADSATSANHATRADNATNANHASSADNATNATNASHATNADNATNADHATSADSATNATNATNADHATNADTATNATNATNWAGKYIGAGGEYTQLNSDSLNAKNASDQYSDLHLQYSGGTVKIGAGGTANLEVSGTISESGTSLVDKYAPISSAFGTECGGRQLWDRLVDISNHYYINNGNIMENNGWDIYYISAKPNTTYSISGVRNSHNAVYFIAFNDDTFLSALNKYTNCTFTTPSACNKLGITVHKYDTSTFMLEEGTTSHDYEPYILSNRQLTERNRQLTERTYIITSTIAQDKTWNFPSGFNSTNCAIQFVNFLDGNNNIASSQSTLISVYFNQQNQIQVYVADNNLLGKKIIIGLLKL